MRRNFDAVQPAGQLGVVHIGLPGVDAEGDPIGGDGLLQPTGDIHDLGCSPGWVLPVTVG